jgi:hypothetical protein
MARTVFFFHLPATIFQFFSKQVAKFGIIYTILKSQMPIVIVILHVSATGRTVFVILLFRHSF